MSEISNLLFYRLAYIWENDVRYLRLSHPPSPATAPGDTNPFLYGLCTNPSGATGSGQALSDSVNESFERLFLMNWF